MQSEKPQDAVSNIAVARTIASRSSKANAASSSRLRTAVNWAVDYAWWAAEPGQKELTDRLHAFFASQGMDTYVNQYSLDGVPLAETRTTGLIACNGAAALAATHPRAWDFVRALWELEPPSGQWRYYDGLLSFMAVLHAGGRFRIY